MRRHAHPWWQVHKRGFISWLQTWKQTHSPVDSALALFGLGPATSSKHHGGAMTTHALSNRTTDISPGRGPRRGQRRDSGCAQPYSEILSLKSFPTQGPSKIQAHLVIGPLSLYPEAEPFPSASLTKVLEAVSSSQGPGRTHASLSP